MAFTALPMLFWGKLWFCASSNTGGRDDNLHLLPDSHQLLNSSTAFHLTTLSICNKQRNKENLTQEMTLGSPPIYRFGWDFFLASDSKSWHGFEMGFE